MSGVPAALSFANTSGSSTTSTAPAATLPGSIPAGSKAIAIVESSNTTRTLTATGWTVVGPTDNGSNFRTWLLTKDVGSADSGTTVTLSLSGAARWTFGGVVVSGWSAIDTSITPAQDTVSGTVESVPALTTTSGQTLGVLLGGSARSFSATDGATPPAGWTELQDLATSNTSASDFAVHVATRAVPSPTTIAAAAGSFAGSNTSLVYVVLVTPSAPTATLALSGAGTLSLTGTPAVGPANLALSGVGTLILGPHGVTIGPAALALSGTGTLALTPAGVAVAAGLTLSGTGSLTFAGFGESAVATRIQLRRNTRAAAAAHNPLLYFGEPGWNGAELRIAPLLNGHWNDLLTIAGQVYVGTTDPGPLLPTGLEYVWFHTDGAGSLVGTILGIGTG